MKILVYLAGLATVFCGLSSLTLAQDSEDLKTSINILSGVLLEGLGLNETPNAFGINVGRVNSVYLQNQGVVMEIRTPLANRRNQLSLNSLASSIQSLPAQANPFALVERPAIASSSETMALSLQQDSAGKFYRDLIDEIEAFDFSGLINASIRQANSSARSLREIDGLDQDSFNNIRQELDLIKQDLQQRMEALRQLDSNLAVEFTPGAGAVADSLASNVRGSLNEIKLGLDQLRNKATQKAENLKQQYEAAKASYAAQWRNEVAGFENTLYELLCNYGATLRILPDDEYLTIVLPDLGEEPSSDNRTDKVHVLRKTDLSQCQAGTIGVATLKQRSSSYSY